MDLQNIILPSSMELLAVAQSKYPIWYREDKQRWTNCVSWFTNYINKKWEDIKLFIKRAFFRWDPKVFEQDYIQIKEIFKNIIPVQWFVWNWSDIFIFCAPILVKVDILEESNRQYVIEIIKQTPKLLKQLKFFIKWFEKLISDWKILDLYGTENLVLSEDDKLYYVDSLYVFAKNKLIWEQSLIKFQYLKQLIMDAENELKSLIN